MQGVPENFAKRPRKHLCRSAEETAAQMISYEFCNYFLEHFRVTASIFFAEHHLLRYN